VNVEALLARAVGDATREPCQEQTTARASSASTFTKVF